MCEYNEDCDVWAGLGRTQSQYQTDCCNTSVDPDFVEKHGDQDRSHTNRQYAVTCSECGWVGQEMTAQGAQNRQTVHRQDCDGNVNRGLHK